jgi:homoserine/homoserine lactone efflux protein
MNLELYLAFVLAASVLILLPGLNVTQIVANAMAYGTRRALLTVAGTQTAQDGPARRRRLRSGLPRGHHGGMVRMAALARRRPSVLAGHAALARAADAEPPQARGCGLFGQGFLVALTNPKVLFFYVAFFPQFIDPALPVGPQLALLC